MQVKIKQLHDAAVLPAYATKGAGAMDVFAHVPTQVKLYPGQVIAVPTGIAVDLPEGYALLIMPRSGLALKNHITVLNTPGLVDSDYRGEIKVLLKNGGDDIFCINPDARIAQMLVLPLPRVEWVVVDNLSETARAEGGFGHTGV